jgi:hypothetical protein
MDLKEIRKQGEYIEANAECDTANGAMLSDCGKLIAALVEIVEEHQRVIRNHAREINRNVNPFDRDLR